MFMPKALKGWSAYSKGVSRVYFIVNLIISFLFASNKDMSTDTDDFWIYFFMYFVGLTIVYYVLKWVIKGFIKK